MHPFTGGGLALADAILWRMQCFAITPPGLAPLCAAELQKLGIAAAPDAAGAGVSWDSDDLRTVYRANLEVRTASRVVVRAGSFRARTFAELERRASKLPWREFLAPGAAVSLRVTSRKSRLYHTDAVAERLLRVLGDAAGVRDAGVVITDDADDVGSAGVDAVSGSGAVSAADVAQLIIVRLHRDECTISVDGSGALLHQRGYRQALAKAPVRETLAAAMLLASGWRGDSPLADPLCGSGTIPIEAALLARHIAPGLARPDHRPRSYAFEQWPRFDGSLWDDVVTHARSAIRGAPGVTIHGWDRNAGAISAARANAARAGVSEDVSFAVRPLAELEVPPGPGAIVTNPPYGVRVGTGASVKGLYLELGRAARVRAPGWTLTILSADDRLASAIGVPLQEQLRTSNGGIPVRIVTGVIPGSAGVSGV